MNGEDLTKSPTESMPIGDGIDALKNKGYDASRIIEIMSSVGYNPSEVSNEFVRRHEEERQAFLQDKQRREDLFKQQREAYDSLKKKDSPSEPDGEFLGSETQSFGVQPAVADPRIFQIRQNDELAMSGVSNSRIGTDLVKAVNSNDFKGISKALELAQGNGFLSDFNVADEYSPETMARLQESGNQMIDAARDSYKLALTRANEMNKSLGIDIEYDVNSESDFGLFLRESFERVNRDEKEFNQKVEEFIEKTPSLKLSDDYGYGDYLYSRLNLDNAISGTVLAGIDIGKKLAGPMYPGFSSLYTDPDVKETEAYYANRIKTKDAEASQIKKQFYEDLNISEEAYSRGLTERTMAAWDGDVSIGDYLATTVLETGAVMADGIKSITEMVVNPLLLATDVFGKSFAETKAYSPHLSSTEALLTSAARAAVEVGVERATMGLGVGAEFLTKQFLKGSQKAAIEKAKKELSGKLTETLGKTIAYNTLIEGLEEGVVEIANYAIDMIDDVAMGRNVKSLNMSAVGDAFFAGMAGGFGPIAITQLPSHRGHIRFMEQRSKIMETIAYMRKDYESETDPVKKQELENDLVKAMAAAKVITNEEVKLYDEFSPEEKRTAIMYNQEIANAQQILKSGKYWNGESVTQEEREAIEQRLENAINRKAQLEQRVEQRQAEEAAEEEVNTPPKAQDASGQNAEAKVRNVKESEKKSHDNVPEASEPAPSGQEGQAVQLSLFDEVTEPESAPQPEAKTEEAPKKAGQYSAAAQIESHNSDPEAKGSTFTLDGVNQAGQDKTSVSIFPERSKIIDGDITAEDLEAFVRENNDLLEGNEDVLSVGTWFDAKENKTYIDISATVDRAAGIELGKQYNQKAVWDLKKMEEVDTGGTGTAEGGLKPESERISDIRRILKAEAETEKEGPEAIKEEREDVFEINVAEGEKVDLTDSDMVGDGAGQIPIPVASAINKMTKAFGGVLKKLGTKVKFHKTDESFGTISPEMKAEMKALKNKDGVIFGYYDKNTNTIHLNNNTEAIDTFEEFGHAVLEGVIGKDAEARQRLYEEMEKIARGKTKGAKAVRDILEETKKFYEGRPEATLQEESIISVLVRYANNPDQFLSVKDKIRAALNRIFKGVGVKGNVIKGDEGLFELADKFRSATQGVETKVEAPVAEAVEPTEEAPVTEEAAVAEEAPVEVEPKRATETEEQFQARLAKETEKLLEGAEGIETPKEDVLERAEDIDMYQGKLSVRQKKGFDYLKDTEIFYTHYPSLGPDEAPIASSRYTTYSAQKSVKVNDYFHFRNWYNKQTGNQRALRVVGMYFIKDGKKYNVSPPRPRVDRGGNPVFMELPKTYRQRERIEAFKTDKEKTDVRRQASDIRDEARKLFRQLPWASFVNINQFEPPAPEFTQRTYDQDYRVSVIAKKNIEAALQMGLTKADIEKRLDDSGRARRTEALNRAQDSDILNPTELILFDDAETGDAVGMFAIRKKKDLGAADNVMSDDQMKDFKEGDIDDYEDVFMPVNGYDQTMPDSEKGVTSGMRAVQYLDNADLPELNEGESIVSTHVTLAHARNRLERYRSEAEQRYKNTGQLSGTFGAGFAPLTPEATRGNPDVLKVVIRGLIARSRDKEVGLSGAAMFDLFTTKAQSIIRTMVRQAENDGYEGLSQETAQLFASSKFTRKVKTQKQFEEIMNVVIDYNDKIKDQFEGRKPLLSRDVMNEFFKHERFELGRDVPETGTNDEKISEYFNDPAVASLKPATLFGAKRFRYEIDEDVLKSEGVVVLKNMRVTNLDGYGFKGALVVDGESSPLEVFKEQYTLDRLDPDFIEGQIPVMDSKKAAELKAIETAYGKAEMLNRYSNYELNSSNNDVNGKASIREARGLKSVRTDQGTFEVSDLTSFQTWRNKWIKRLQDKYVDIFKLQEDVETARGARAQSQDFKMAEELMYGKAAEDLRKLDERVDAITSEMKAQEISVGDISEYLYALHASERNALIEERTEGKQKDGSGMSNEEAQAILDSVPSDKKAAYDSIVNAVREIQQDTRDTMVKFGLETQETIDAFEAMFDNYIPLAGLAVDEESSATSSYPTGGAGLSVFGPTTKRAMGRKSQAENVLAQVIAQNSSVHIKARTNEALQSLYNLVNENPNANVWSIVDGSKATSQDPHSVSVRVKGEQKFIRFKDASHAETLRNMNLPATSVFVRMLRAPSNWLRRSFTTLNPEFMISNFSRDIQAAMFNAAAEADIPGGIVEGEGIVGDMIKKVPATLRALLKAETPEALGRVFKENPDIERYYNDFREDGGKTGWSYAKPLADIAAELESKTNEPTKMQQVLGVAENFARTVEGVNDAFENSIRLSAYIAAREKGVSREKAAQLAKNITVNFNKSGEYGQLLNSVYLFFNASVQGTARLGRSLLTLKAPTYPDGTKRSFKDRMNNAQKMAGALTVFNGMLTMLALAMSGEDEDGELYYNKIPDYVKERNLIIMRPDGKNYYKIPLPYGFSLFANLGSTAVEVGAGHKEIDTAMMQMTSSFINSFSPISFGQSRDLFTKAGKSIVPTVFKPLVDVMTNETYFGGPVYTENLPYGTQKPESSMSFRSPESVQQFFRWMNEATGGSVDVKGDLDFNPDKMWYMFEYFIGGAGKFVTRTGEAARGLAAKASDNDLRIEANDLPFLRVLYGEPSKYMDMEDYRKRRQEVMELKLEMKNARRKDDPDRYKGIFALSESLKMYDEQLKNIRRQKRKALEIKDYAERMKRIQELRDKERSIVMKFNKRYEQTRD